MKKKQPWLQTMATIALAASAVLPGVPVSAEEPKSTKTEQLIVKYKHDETLSSKQKKNIGVETVKENDEVGLYDVKEDTVDTTITEIEKMDNVEYVEKNVTYKTAETIEPNDTYYKNQWNLPAIEAQEGWESIEDSSNLVKVAVLDTGVQDTHEDLTGRVLEGKTFVDGYQETYQGDDQGHGTFVSGIIAANANNEKGITGVAGDANVSILPVKVMNKSGVGDAYNIASGIDYAVAQGVDVINMSLSGEYSETIETAVKKATDKGIVVVAASGNGGGNADASYPAALPNVLSVGAIAPKDQVYERSNYGSTLDIVAPGVSVLSTSLLGDLGTDAGRYSTGSGTSYAAPHVAAVAALYKLKHPEATASQVEEALTSTATDLNEEGWDEKTGHGKLNAKAALADDVEIPSLAFVLPKKNANVVGTTTVQIAINDPSTSKTTFYTDEVNEKNRIGEAETANVASVQIKWDTTKLTDGTHQLIAIAVDANGKELSRTSNTVKILNTPQSGYMFTVTTPSGTIAKGASVKLYEKVQTEDSDEYSYAELWTGTTDTEGALRVPSHVGTDLKNLQVVVQGKFDTADGNSWFMYSREVASSGAITLKSDNTVPVKLNTLDEGGKEIPGAQYFLAMKDDHQTTLGSTTMINEKDAKEAPTVYVDKGAYNVFSYHKTAGKTYFLSNTTAEINDTSTISFDSREAGEAAIDNSDNGLENGILYLYNDAISEAIGSDEVITGQKFFVSPGDYEYLVDAEVKDPDGGENWVYVFANDKTKAVVQKGKKTIIKAGGKLDITKFEPDQESLKRYYTQRGLTYIERPYPNIAYKLDRAFYTKQVFGDEYGNKLSGMYRGSLNSEDALYKKDVVTGKTVSIGNDDEAQIETINFGDIYSKYKVTRLSDQKVMLDSFDKNPTNPANRQYYFYSFWVTSSSDVTQGKYEISLTLDKSPLAPKGLFKALNIDMQDSGTTMQVKNAAGNNVPAYITINTLEKDEDGELDWVQSYGQNTDTSKSLSLPSNLALSDEKNGNMAIIRYLQPSGEYSYIFRQFSTLEELETINIPANMQKVSVSAKDGDEKLEK
ncbi:S8 family peptidase, partial [Peribacillus psychrosaccharolyticus]